MAIVLGIVCLAAAYRARGETERPVLVSVVGHGAIRLRLAAGITAPCDSSENRMIFDGWVAPGTYRWDTSANNICYEHTFGALRESDWSTSRVVSTTKRRDGKPCEIVVPTD
jgi:hypothetical protein